MSGCLGPECSRPVRARGMCATHYVQWYKNRPLTPIRSRRPVPPARLVPCPACGADAGEDCTTVTPHGRRAPRNGYHVARHQQAEAER